MPPMPHLPDECWHDILRLFARPQLGFRISQISRRFDALSRAVLLSKQHARHSQPLVLFCDRIGWVRNGAAEDDEQQQRQHFVELPMPERPPPKNLKISSISVYCTDCLCNALAIQFLRLITSLLPCAIQLDGTSVDPCRRHLRHFERADFGTIFAVRRLKLKQHPEWGLPLTALFNNPHLDNIRQSVLKIPMLECQLLNESDITPLLAWLHHYNGDDGKQLFLFCEEYCAGKHLANKLIRLIFQIFSHAQEACPFAVQFLFNNPSDASLLSASIPSQFSSFSPRNFDTGEQLKIAVELKGQKVKMLLERTKMARKCPKHCIEQEELALADQKMVENEVESGNECLISFK